MRRIRSQGLNARVATLFVPAAAFLILASCTSVPSWSPLYWMGILPANATMYVAFSVPSSAELLKTTLKQAGPGYKDYAQVVDRTERVMLSVSTEQTAISTFPILQVPVVQAKLKYLHLPVSRKFNRCRSVFFRERLRFGSSFHVTMHSVAGEEIVSYYLMTTRVCFRR